MRDILGLKSRGFGFTKSCRCRHGVIEVTFCCYRKFYQSPRPEKWVWAEWNFWCKQDKLRAMISFSSKLPFPSTSLSVFRGSSFLSSFLSLQDVKTRYVCQSGTSAVRPYLGNSKSIPWHTNKSHIRHLYKQTLWLRFMPPPNLDISTKHNTYCQEICLRWLLRPRYLAHFHCSRYYCITHHPLS